MKLLHVIGSLEGSFGGPGYALKGVLNALTTAGQGIQHSVASNVSQIGLADQMSDEFGGRYAFHEFKIVDRAPFYYSSGTASWFRRRAREYDAMAIHGMWNWPTMCALTRCRLDGLPFAIRPAGSLDPFDLRKKRALKTLLGRTWLRWAFDGGAEVHCTSDLEGRRLETFGAAAKVTVLPIPVSDPIRGLRQGRNEARRHFGIPSNGFVALFLSRINYKKGLDILLPTLKKLKKRTPELCFIFAGEGREGCDGDVLRFAEEQGFGDGAPSWVKRVGHLSGERKALAFAASDVYVLPSQNENFGVSVMEAAAAGVALAVSPGVYLAEELRAKNAAVVLERRHDAWLDGLRALAERPDRVRELGKSARAVWADNYSPEALGPRYLEFYRRLGPRPRVEA